MASSSSLTLVGDYDVFLSFRGEDTRKNIVSHLDKALRDERINTFKDDRTIYNGESFPDKLITAIQTSRLAIVVISENYANSIWCLEELRMIMKRRDAGGGIDVIPIFYGVEPSDVKRQKGSFGDAFAKVDDERIPQWKAALTRVTYLHGPVSSTCLDDATMVEKVVKDVSKRVFPAAQTDHEEDIIERRSHMEILGSMLEIESGEEVRSVGISGMVGVGKTKIAEYFYKQFSCRFTARCFIYNVRDIYKKQGLLRLHEEVLSKIGQGTRLKRQKVILVLDGVDKKEQLYYLNTYQSWFGPGSRIIITARNKDLLNLCNVVLVHVVKCLDQEDALKIVKHFLSNEGLPPDYFEQLLTRISRLAHGLPSALRTLISGMQGKTTVEECEQVLLGFEKAPHESILSHLRRGYKDLKRKDQIAFLHVACLFNGYHFLRASDLLDGDGKSSIRKIMEQSLVDISAQGFINMNFLVEQTGRQIVIEGSPKEQIILWKPDDICNILHYNKGEKKKLEGLALHMCEMSVVSHFKGSGFTCMPNVKFLKFYTHLDDKGSNLQLRPQESSLPGMLRLLHWDAYPLTTLPSDFIPRHLVELTLRYSKLEIFSNQNLKLGNLKRLDVTGSKDLTELPDLSEAMKLEELTVEDCRRLERISMSTCSLRKVDISNCVGLASLPDFVSIWISHATYPIFFRCQGTRLQFEIEKLEPFAHLSIEGDIKIRLQNIVGDAEHLSYISEPQTTGELILRQPSHWPKSKISGKSLDIKRFNYREGGAPFTCASFLAFSGLAELKLINLNIHKLPNDIDLLQSLEKLDLTGNDFKHLPTTLETLDKLIFVKLRNCRQLEGLPNLTQLQTLKLSGCTNFRSLPSHRDIYNLLKLNLDNCKNVQSLTHRLGEFTNLMHLDLSRHDFETIPASITELLQLGTLCINNCKELKSLTELPRSLNYLNAHGCSSLETVSFPDSIEHLDLSECSQFNQHEKVITQFLKRGQHEEASLRFACIPGNVVPSYFDKQSTGASIRVSQEFMGFSACILVACKRPFHLQFQASNSYSWNWKAGGEFRINLRPNIYCLSGNEEQEAVTSHHLVIIQVFNKNNDQVRHFRFKPELQFSQAFSSPPVEIEAHRVHIL